MILRHFFVHYFESKVGGGIHTNNQQGTTFVSFKKSEQWRANQVGGGFMCKR